MIRKALAWLCICIASYCGCIYAVIIETAHFSDINQYITPRTLVILDIDDTLLLPAQTLGTDVWILYRVKQLEGQDMERAAAFERALADWEAIRHLTRVKIVEDGTEKIVETMQENRITVMGLTTQGLALATRTVQQLHSLGIDLSKTAPSKEDCYFMNEHGVLYRKGILFTSGTPKGAALLQLLDKIGYHPDHVVFINDKASHLKDVEEAVQKRNITFVGLRYAYGDERVARFDKDIANLQWQYSTLGHLLSDEEAQSIKTATVP